MPKSENQHAADVFERPAKPLTSASYDSLLAAIGEARFVLLREASRGTYEFYSCRTKVTKRLIQDKGFQAVVAEAGWLDAQRVNNYVHGRSADPTAEQALRGFCRFPVWMWRNGFVIWKRSIPRLPAARVSATPAWTKRAIGAVYRPKTERVSLYFYAMLPDQFNALIHIDKIRALRPLEQHAQPHLEEVPEAFPSGV